MAARMTAGEVTTSQKLALHLHLLLPLRLHLLRHGFTLHELYLRRSQRQRQDLDFVFGFEDGDLGFEIGDFINLGWRLWKIAC